MVTAAHWKSYGVVLAIFVLGAIVGSGLTHALSQRRFAGILGEREEFIEKRRIGALGRRLDLDTAQMDRLHVVMARHGDERRRLTRELFERCGAPLKDMQHAVDTEIREILRPEQRARFDQLEAKRRDRFPFGPPR